MKITSNPFVKGQYIRLLHTAFSRNFACNLVEYDAGEVILRQGEDLTYLYFLIGQNSRRIR